MSETNNNSTQAETSEFYSSGIIFSKSTNLSTDSKGRNQVSMLLSEEQTAQLIEAVEKIKSLGKRAKLQVHYTDDNSFLFIKEVQPKGAGFKKTAGGAPMASKGAEGIRSKIAGIKRA